MPKVTNNSLTRVFNLQNIDNSTTAKFVLELNVPSMVYSPDISFVYFVTLKESTDQAPVTYESDRVYFTVTGVATPTPKVTPSPSPSPTRAPTAAPTPSPAPTGTPMVSPSLSPLPTTPEFPAVYVMLTLLLASSAACVVIRRAKSQD